jgi:hypothetical protein
MATGQSLPTVEKSPEIVPYKRVRAERSVNIEPCQADLREEEEAGVIQRVAAGIIPPKVIRMVQISLTKQGQDAYKNGLFKDPNEVISRISVVVGIDGKPAKPCLKRPAGFDLDEQAGNAALQYLFTPAMKDGQPVAMRMILEFRYQTH